MNLPCNDSAYEVTWLVRRLFRAMASAADAYLEDSGQSAAERAVLEFLYPDQRLSVPDIAVRYMVSRQHVQVTVNGLVDKGLLRRENNPRHKRSPLFGLTAAGRAAFAAIRTGEDAIIEELFHEIDPDALETTRATLRTLYEKLAQED